MPERVSPTDSRSAPSADPLVGRVFNERFAISTLIARGGMGKVYRAEQMPLGRPCALKVLDVKYTGDHDPEFHKRFFREASIASKLTHPNSVTIFDYGRTEDDLYYMAMELLEGGTLHRAIRTAGYFPEERAVHVAKQVCRALREAHSLGVIHRDLKPANIFLVTHGDEPDFVKVLDFGLVKNVDEAPGDDLTQTGLFMGSPKYMAPEQINGDRVDARTDIYALGVILFEMLAGKVPFDKSTSVNTLMAHVNDSIPMLRTVNANVSVSSIMEQTVMRCLAKDPKERFASMDDLLSALKQAGKPLGERVGASLSETSGERPVMGHEAAAGQASLPTASVPQPSSSLGAHTRPAEASEGRGSVPVPSVPPASGTPGVLSKSMAPPKAEAGDNPWESQDGTTIFRQRAYRGIGLVSVALVASLAFAAWGRFRAFSPSAPSSGAVAAAELPRVVGDSVVPAPSADAKNGATAGAPGPGEPFGGSSEAAASAVGAGSEREKPGAGEERVNGVDQGAGSHGSASGMGTAGILRLESDPPGATVRENGVEICVATPCDVPWTPTKKGASPRQLFFFKAGFRPETRPVTEASKPVVVHLSRLSIPVRPPPKEQPSAGPPGYKVDIPY